MKPTDSVDQYRTDPKSIEALRLVREVARRVRKRRNRARYVRQYARRCV